MFAYADTLVQARQFDKARKIVAGFEQGMFRDLINGRILLAEGDPRGALASFEKGILLWPNSPGGRFLAGQAAEQIGDFDRAISEYRESIRADPAHTKAGLELANLYLVRGLFGDALDAIQRYMQVNPGDFEGTLTAVRIGHKAHRYGVATEGLKLLSEMPGRAGTALAEHAKLLAESSPDGAHLAVETIEAGELDLTDPANAAALRALIAYLFEFGKPEKAEARIQAALAAHGDAAVFHELHGRVLSATGKPPEQARRAFEHALELDPKHAEALIGLAEVAAEAGTLDAAIALYDQAADLAPEAFASQFAAAKLQIAAGRTDNAEERLKRLLVDQPRDTRGLIALARIFAERGDFEASLDYAQRASWLKASDAEETLAWIEGLRAEQGLAPDAPAASN
jgi:tetratricopeptide (TPR) repeat protein